MKILFCHFIATSLKLNLFGIFKNYCTKEIPSFPCFLKRAHKFYEKHGFKRTGKTGNFFGAIIFEYAKKI
ncbi:MAG: hypothetical protein P8Y70_13675 [Candidatus Lokiarchaeota archaeon]